MLADKGTENNEPTAVKDGLAAGYDPNNDAELHPKFGTTPLMEAAFHGHDDIVKQLIEHNARLNTQSGYGWTALPCVCMGLHVLLFRLNPLRIVSL